LQGLLEDEKNEPSSTVNKNSLSNLPFESNSNVENPIRITENENREESKVRTDSQTNH
jgi:hypothetical protein